MAEDEGIEPLRFHVLLFSRQFGEPTPASSKMGATWRLELHLKGNEPFQTTRPYAYRKNKLATLLSDPASNSAPFSGPNVENRTLSIQ